MQEEKEPHLSELVLPLGHLKIVACTSQPMPPVIGVAHLTWDTTALSLRVLSVSMPTTRSSHSKEAIRLVPSCILMNCLLQPRSRPATTQPLLIDINMGPQLAAIRYRRQRCWSVCTKQSTVIGFPQNTWCSSLLLSGYDEYIIPTILSHVQYGHSTSLLFLLFRWIYLS